MSREFQEAYEEAMLTAGLTMEFRRVMAAEGISHAQAAERMGVSQPRVTQLLGRENMTLETAARVAFALGCRIEFKLVPREDVEE